MAKPTSILAPVVVGIGGEKHHGKDLLAKAVHAALTGYSTAVDPQHTAFANVLKEMASRIFHIPLEVFHDQGRKEVPFSEPLPLDDFRGRMEAETDLPIKFRDQLAKSPRHVLQLFGTEYVRSIDPGFWVNRTLREDRDLIVSDVRFDDEADAIRARGGIVVRIVRTDLPPSFDSHVSERITFEPDIIVRLKTGEFTKLNAAASGIAAMADAYRRPQL